MEKYNSPLWLQWTVNSFLKQSAKAENHNHDDDDDDEEETTSYFQTSQEMYPYCEKLPRGQRVLVDSHPHWGLFHLHVVHSVLGLPSDPPRHPCLPRCAAVYVEQ